MATDTYSKVEFSSKTRKHLVEDALSHVEEFTFSSPSDLTAIVAEHGRIWSLKDLISEHVPGNNFNMQQM
ncbi:hypothetical protein CEXT_309811 [Caerostris extrusa]|uniref:Uncharacterized protein n=1 Tax=Caerostris extrusa TaxID=172846 RepID=A0AAV4UGP8_CAEEX|nr:hypothetical protein CEXT_309811 [Caerostris extrusa]